MFFLGGTMKKERQTEQMDLVVRDQGGGCPRNECYFVLRFTYGTMFPPSQGKRVMGCELHYHGREENFVHQLPILACFLFHN